MGLCEHQVQDIIILGLVFFVSLISALALTLLADRLAWKVGLIDTPGGRKKHPECVTRAGGLAIALAVFLTLGVMLKWSNELLAYWSAAAVLLFTGLADDKYQLSSKHKFPAQIMAVVLFMYLGGIWLEDLGDILGIGSFELSRLSPWLTVFAMVGVINAFNMSDGLDGLAAGMAGIACLFFIPFAYAQESWIYLLILTGLFGSLLGFLRFNIHPARLFMGDSGSMFLGFSLAAAAIVLTQGEVAGRQEYLPITALIILSLPIWDTLFVMFRRLLSGSNPFKPDRHHLHHRLMSLGISHQVTVSAIYGLMFFMGMCAWLVRPWPEWVQFYSLLGFYVLLYSGIWLLEKRAGDLDKGIDSVYISARPGKRAGRLITWTSSRGKMFFVLVWTGFMVPALIPGQTGAGLAYYVFFITVLMVIYYPWKDKKHHMPVAHVLMFFGIFSVLLIYHVKFFQSTWFGPYMLCLSGIAGVWTVLRVWGTYRLRVLVPGCFEILLLGAAIVSPILLHYSFEIDEHIRIHLVQSFLYSIPLFLMLKAWLRRIPSSNRRFIIYMLVLLILTAVIGI
ncbi:MraY family glycosyltransferase [Desulfonatronospira sp.]|uniref:MraY family glycosyltransferase n=1 Tax=Desulfonatronospira sp. TaxID=1962951 RepID=UPI0025B7E6FD|nr:MraY family glycosyltransferase [Desulfonatronospira sp.]